MSLDYVKGKKKWIPLRILLDLLGIIGMLLIGYYTIDTFFYVWIVYFIAVALMTCIGLALFFFTVPIFREKDSDIKFSNLDRGRIYGTLAVGVVILIASILGLVTIPAGFRPVFIMNSERVIRLFLFVAYCFIVDFFVTLYAGKMISKVIDLQKHLDPNTEFTISTNIKTDREFHIARLSQRIFVLLSCSFEFLSFTGLSFLISTFIFR